MNEPDSPQRLRTAAAPGSPLAAGLSAARARGPSDGQLRALEAALAASLGAAAAGAGASVAAGKGAASAPLLASAGALKIGALFVMLAAAGGALMLGHRHHAESARSIGAVATTAPLPTPAQSSPLPAAPVAAPEVIAAPSAAPRLGRAERFAGTSRARRGAAAPDELALVERAQRTLGDDPGAALALVEENRRALAQSAFAQEAEVIAVAALARLGRAEDARDRAARFLARFPDSVHAARMRHVAAIIK